MVSAVTVQINLVEQRDNPDSIIHRVCICGAFEFSHYNLQRTCVKMGFTHGQDVLTKLYATMRLHNRCWPGFDVYT